MTHPDEDDDWDMPYTRDDDLPMVCVQHLRFIPCRTNDGCQLSTHPDAITAVRNFQNGVTSD